MTRGDVRRVSRRDSTRDVMRDNCRDYRRSHTSNPPTPRPPGPRTSNSPPIPTSPTSTRELRRGGVDGSSPNVNPTEPGDLSCSGKQGDPDMTTVRLDVVEEMARLASMEIDRLEADLAVAVHEATTTRAALGRVRDLCDSDQAEMINDGGNNWHRVIAVADVLAALSSTNTTKESS